MIDTIDTLEVWQLRDALNALPDNIKMHVSAVGNLSLVEDGEYIGIINLDWMEIEYFDGRGYYIKFGKRRGPETIYDEEE